MCYSANGFTVVTFESWTSPEILGYLNPYSTIMLVSSQTCAVFSVGHRDSERYGNITPITILGPQPENEPVGVAQVSL